MLQGDSSEYAQFAFLNDSNRCSTVIIRFANSKSSKIASSLCCFRFFMDSSHDRDPRIKPGWSRAERFPNIGPDKQNFENLGPILAVRGSLAYPVSGFG